VRKLVASIKTVFSPDEGTKTKIAEAVPSVETLIGILPFQNYTADQSLDWIGKGIGASLTTTLSQLQGFHLVERQQLEQILSEQRLQASALFDPETVVESGRLWNTRYLILGGYQKLGDSYRLDGWRVDTETGRIFDARGSLERIFLHFSRNSANDCEKRSITPLHQFRNPQALSRISP